MSSIVVSDKKGKTGVHIIVTFILLSALFFSLVGYLYTDTEAREKETIHIQTKQIKDDLTLQILSDRENLATMANFAAKLYLDGEDYTLLFDSFKAIGLIENIGILNPDNVCVTKTGSMDLGGKISFADEAAKGAYITGRVADLTNSDYERVRSAVPIVANGETVGILYGMIKLDSIEARYTGLAAELDAQLFVYDKTTGDLIVDSVHNELGNISFLKDRRYNKGHSYEEFASTDKGFTSFESAYREEDVLMHYSTIEELGWGIALVRYDSQVYAETHALLNVLLGVFAAMAVVMGLFAATLMTVERRKNNILNCASEIRKILIEASGNNSSNNITAALREAVMFTKARSAVFFDTDNLDYHFISTEFNDVMLSVEQRMLLKAELSRYISERIAHEDSVLRVIRLRRTAELEKTNPSFYEMIKEYGISEIVFSAAVDQSNHIAVLGIIDPKRSDDARYLADKVSACFTIALNNHNILNRTRSAAITDSLTGALNRVAYSSDLHVINEEKPFDFTCIYIDVNELHYRNNRFGHASGDEMLLYIAHSLKDVFFGQAIYRMGGDEFVVFCRGLSQDDIKRGIEVFLNQLKLRDYNVSLGVSFRSRNTNTEEMVQEAEARMYDNKARYYQNKKKIASANDEYVQVKTGIVEIDTVLSILKESYNGIYRVSLNTDVAQCILMPAYLNYNKNEEHFSGLFAKYVSDFAESDYHRALLSFMNYDAIKRQLDEGVTPRITYKKVDGETVTLSVYSLGDSKNIAADTLWVFAKK